MASDQTASLQFGLGKDTRISKLAVRLANDKEINIDNPKINSIIDLKADVEKHKTIIAETTEENNINL